MQDFIKAHPVGTCFRLDYVERAKYHVLAFIPTEDIVVIKWWSRNTNDWQYAVRDLPWWQVNASHIRKVK